MLKKTLFLSCIIASSIALQGCILAAVGVGTTATKVAVDPRTTGSQVDDITLYTKINATLNDRKLQPFFEDSRINSSVYNGNVLLVGQAANRAQIERASALIQNIQGVENVYNQIKLGETIGIGTVTNDSWITSKVKSNLISNAKTKARDIKVVTEDGVVYLMGLLSYEDGNEAAIVASKISGVKEVVKVFIYTE